MHFSGSSETRVVSQFCWWSLSRSHGCLGHIGDWYYLWLWEFSGIIADDGNPYPRYHWYHHIISQYISCLLKPFHAFQNLKDSPPRSTSEKLTFTKDPIPMWQSRPMIFFTKRSSEELSFDRFPIWNSPFGWVFPASRGVSQRFTEFSASTSYELILKFFELIFFWKIKNRPETEWDIHGLCNVYMIFMHTYMIFTSYISGLW